MPNNPTPVLLSEIVRRACEVVDPDDEDAVVGEFERIFEDADEPVTAVEDLEGRLANVVQTLDPAVANGTIQMLGALTAYLSYRRDEIRADDERLLRLAARAEWEGDPPGVVADWLADRGVEI